MKRLFFYITAATVLIACKKDENTQPKQLFYTQNYSINWNMDDDISVISGSIGSSENDYKYLSSDDKSVISINGLKFTPPKYPDYHNRVGTSFLGLVGADFILYKSDGSMVKNKVNASEVRYADFAPDFPTIIPKSKVLNIEWVGQLPIDNGEKLSVSILGARTQNDSTGWQPTARVLIEGVYNSNKVEIPQSELAKLPEGDAIVNIGRGGGFKQLAIKDNDIPSYVSFSSIATRKVKIVN